MIKSRPCSTISKHVRPLIMFACNPPKHAKGLDALSLIQTKWSTPTNIGYYIAWHSPCSQSPIVKLSTSFQKIDTCINALSLASQGRAYRLPKMELIGLNENGLGSKAKCK